MVTTETGVELTAQNNNAILSNDPVMTLKISWSTKAKQNSRLERCRHEHLPAQRSVDAVLVTWVS